MGPVIAGLQPKPALRAIMRGGLGDKRALREDYLDGLLQVAAVPATRPCWNGRTYWPTC